MHFLTVPVFDHGAAEAELNRFLASHRVLAVERELVTDGTRSAWAICVTNTDGLAAAAVGGASPVAGQTGRKRGDVDYREVLSEEEFRVFARLRTLRKELAEKEGIPAYALFTNEQLAAMVRDRVRSLGALAKLDGVGKARVEKYGPAFVAILEAVPAATPAPSEVAGAA